MATYAVVTIEGDEFTIKSFPSSKEMREFVNHFSPQLKRNSDIALLAYDGETLFVNAEALIVMLSDETTRLDAEARSQFGF